MHQNFPTNKIVIKTISYFLSPTIHPCFRPMWENNSYSASVEGTPTHRPMWDNTSSYPTSVESTPTHRSMWNNTGTVRREESYMDPTRRGEPVREQISTRCQIKVILVIMNFS
ncbi:uncharacterized protein LOC118404831 isoform X1 [Branchiostoma floridae]|uniref:Uncharacterized protein LOC118404831 isoform X1 n=1 Tax=Branchiostoma floridae TaxID=7739 RepID=A0A9J7HKS2_BRAFL|nr:uncharacterized protein LOC118404831 isoform X1 [Branchiostoma floridae]